MGGLFRAWRLQFYVLVEFASALALATGVFIGLFLLMTSLGMARLGERHGVEPGPMLLALPYLLPYLLCFALPLAFLVAGVLAFGRLESSGEVCAMRAAGASLWSVAAGPFAAAFLALGLLLVAADSGIEWGFARASDVVLESGRASLLRRAGRSHTLKIDLPDRAFRIHRFAPAQDGESPLAIVEFAHGEPREVMLARDHELEPGPSDQAAPSASETLRFALCGGSGRASWVRILGPGEAITGGSGTLDLVVDREQEGPVEGPAGRAEKGDLAASVSAGSAAGPPPPPERASWRRKTLPWSRREYSVGLSTNLREAQALRARLAELEREELDAALSLAAVMLGGGSPSEEAARRLEEAERAFARSREEIGRTSRRLRLQEMEVHRKLSMAAGPVALLLLGIPLGLRLSRGGRLAAFTAGVAAVAVLYYPLWMSGQGLAISGALPPGPAVWAADATAAAAGAVWLRRLA